MAKKWPPFFTKDEVGELLGVAESTAYKVIRTLNEELKAKGFMVQRGRIPSRYFIERFGLEG